MEKKPVITEETFLSVQHACFGWIKLFVRCQDILREMEARKIVPLDLYKSVHYLAGLEQLPKKYRKGDYNAD